MNGRRRRERKVFEGFFFSFFLNSSFFPLPFFFSCHSGTHQKNSSGFTYAWKILAVILPDYYLDDRICEPSKCTPIFFCPKQRNSHDFQWRHILFQSRWIHCDSICRLQWNLAFAPCCLVRAFLRLYFTLKHQISCICGSLVGYSAFLSFFIEFVKHNCSDNLLTVRNKYFAEPAWRQGFDKRVGPISIFLSISSLHSFGFQESFLKERGREMIVSFLEEDAFFLL